MKVGVHIEPHSHKTFAYTCILLFLYTTAMLNKTCHEIVFVCNIKMIQINKRVYKYTVKNKFSTYFYARGLLKPSTCIQISFIIHYGQTTWKIIRLDFLRYFTSKRYPRATLGFCTVVRFTQY